MKRSRVTIMESGMCHRKICFNKGPRCGKGYCASCCKAFHDHVGLPNGTVVASNVFISTAIQPTLPPEYRVGGVQLLLTQDITPRGGDAPFAA